MRDKTIEAMRLILTVTGLVLLFVFGTRAASQAGDMKLAGGAQRHYDVAPSFTVADMAQLNPWLSGIATGESLAMPLYTAAHSVAAHPVSSAPPTTVSRADTRHHADTSHKASAPARLNQQLPQAPAHTPAVSLTTLNQQPVVMTANPKH